VNLAPLTTIGVGGLAKWYTACESNEEIATALEWARSKNLPVHVLGGGSNSLISDAGFSGLVLHVASKGVRWYDTRCEVLAGEAWDEVVQATLANGYSEFVCLSGIPGTTGAAPIQNIGAYGQDVASAIESVKVLHRKTLQISTLSNKDCKFAYRFSAFKGELRNEYIILSVLFRFEPHKRPNLTYPDIAQSVAATHFDQVYAQNPKTAFESLRAVVLEVRSRKGMVVDPYDLDSKSLGSFFMNPVVSAEQWNAFEKTCDRLGIEQRPPQFNAGEQRYKIPAAWLIEHSGTKRGERLNKASVSSKHSLALVNRGGATADDVLCLAALVADRVKTKFDIQLKMEPETIGFDDINDSRLFKIKPV